MICAQDYGAPTNQSRLRIRQCSATRNPNWFVYIRISLVSKHESTYTNRALKLKLEPNETDKKNSLMQSSSATPRANVAIVICLQALHPLSVTLGTVQQPVQA